MKDRQIDRMCILDESQISTELVGTEYDTDNNKKYAYDKSDCIHW